MLSISNLWAGYGRDPVLKGVSLPELAPGRVTAVIGPNAAGKSTLLKAIAGLIPARAGEARLGSENLLSLRASARARRVRFVPQAYATTARLTVYDLLVVARMCGTGGTPARADLAAVDAALERTGTGDLADRPVGALSGGQQQLVALAQALTRSAPVLLLDEPTSALDLRNGLEAMGVLRRVAEEDEAIVVAALHDLNLAARHADRVVLMSGGRVAADGAPAAVLASDGCGRAYGVVIEAGLTRRGALSVDAYLPSERREARAP